MCICVYLYIFMDIYIQTCSGECWISEDKKKMYTKEGGDGSLSCHVLVSCHKNIICSAIKNIPVKNDPNVPN